MSEHNTAISSVHEWKSSSSSILQAHSLILTTIEYHIFKAGHFLFLFIEEFTHVERVSVPLRMMNTVISIQQAGRPSGAH